MEHSPVQDAVENVECARTSPSQTVGVLINTAVGAGVLSLPFAFSRAGLVGGLLILVAVAAVECFTLYVLARWAEATGANSYGELVHRALGPAAAAVLTATLLAYLFGSCVAYLVIIGDTVQPVLSHLLGDTAWTCRSAVIAGVGTVLILPLSLPSTLAALAPVSGINFAAFIAVICAILYRSMQIVAVAADPWAGGRAFSPCFLDAVPIIVFGLQCHATVVAAFNELDGGMRELPSLRQLLGGVAGGAEAAGVEEGAQERLAQPRRKSIKLLGMTRVITTAIGITAAGYAVVGCSAYLAFPTTAQSNILNSFAARDPLMQVARAVVGVLEIASYPVNHFPARVAVRELSQHVTGRAVGGRAFEVVETLAFFAATLFVALSVTNLGAVFGLIGGTCGSLIILGLPGAILVQYAWSKQQRSREVLHSPLLGVADGVQLYSAWGSKLFAAGLMLCTASAALILFTILPLII